MSSDFDEEELELLATLLERRYGRATAFECAEAELGSDSPQTCAAVLWEGRGAQFVVCKTGESRYRAQFFLGDAAAFAGRPEYGDLAECVNTLLRLQSDEERARRGVFSGATAATLSAEEYDGPVVI
jgi:hypothetical protein